MNNHPDIERAARDLAQAEADLQDARQRHADLLAEVSAVEARLQDVAARRAKVREDLAAGTLTDREAGGLLALVDEDAADLRQLQIGRASCRERVCQYVWISVVAVSLKKKKKLIKE